MWRRQVQEDCFFRTLNAGKQWSYILRHSLKWHNHEFMSRCKDRLGGENKNYTQFDWVLRHSRDILYLIVRWNMIFVVLSFADARMGEFIAVFQLWRIKEVVNNVSDMEWSFSHRREGCETADAQKASLVRSGDKFSRESLHSTERRVPEKRCEIFKSNKFLSCILASV